MDYDDYLLNNNNRINDEERMNDSVTNNNNNNKVGVGKILIIVILIAVLLFLIIKLLGISNNSNQKAPVLFINESQIIMDVGDEHNIDYKFDNGGNNAIILNWSADDKSIVSVDNSGKVVALLEGSTVVKAAYKYKGKEVSKLVTVLVQKKEPVIDPIKDKPDFNYDVSVKDGEWSKNDVIIKINNINSNYSVKYSLNCIGDKCDEIMVNNGTIIITESGQNTVYVTVTNNDNGLSETKTIKVNIDKVKPTCELKLVEKDIVVSTVEKESGIKYVGPNSSYSGTSVERETATEGNKTYYVMDNAGNQNTCTINVEKLKYVITLDNQGATTPGTKLIEIIVGSETNPSVINIPEKSGYEFMGYYTETDGGGTKVIKSTGAWMKGYANPGTKITSDMTLYAKWKSSSGSSGGSSSCDRTYAWYAYWTCTGKDNKIISSGRGSAGAKSKATSDCTTFGYANGPSCSNNGGYFNCIEKNVCG